MFSYEYDEPVSFSEFYDGMQSLKSNIDYNGSFGKVTDYPKSNPKQARGFKKITSVQQFNQNKHHHGSIKKSSSSNSFTENDTEQFHFGKPVSNYRYTEESTRDSCSHFSSTNSMSSASNSMMGFIQKGGMMKPQGKRKIATEVDFRNKYKTEVCRYWAENGWCEFGDSCAFAHGGAEIRQKSFVANNFKTKRCVAYHETGYCVYGVRCQFLHCYRKDCHYNPRLVFTSYAEDLDNIETWLTDDQDCLCLRRTSRPRLPFMAKLAMGWSNPDDEIQDLIQESVEQNWGHQ